MAIHVVLLNFTEQGRKNIKGTVDRSRAVRADNERRGIKTHGIYWTQGQYDIIAIFEGDETALTAATLNILAAGNLRATTLRAFTESEVEAALAKI